MVKSKNRTSAMPLNARASTAWSEDNAKFGQRMLEKMGWKKGQGLGIRSQGVTENIKLRLKLDSKGLGYKVSDQDQWLQVEHNFSSVLSRLNEEKDVAAANSTLPPKQSLESVSMKSKNRVHYRKFTRGKDVSRYNEEDLVGILGQRKKRLIESELRCEETGPEPTEGSVAAGVPDVSLSSPLTDEKSSRKSRDGTECTERRSISLDTVAIGTSVERSPPTKSCVATKRRNTAEDDDHQINDNELMKAEPNSIGSVSFSRRKRRLRDEKSSEEYANLKDMSPDILVEEDAITSLNTREVQERNVENVVVGNAEDCAQGDHFSSETEMNFRTDKTISTCRKKTKAERIIEKNRLLQKFLNEQVGHEFIGSNLNNISGYGNRE